MIDKIKKSLNNIKSKYAEIRIEEYTATSIKIVGNEVEDCKIIENLGGNCRVLSDGGWGFVSFNDIKNLNSHLKSAVTQSQNIKNESILLNLDTPVIKKNVYMIPENNPQNHTIDEKFLLCDKYNNLIKKNKIIQTSSVTYADIYKKVYYVNNLGCEIITEKVFSGISLSAVIRDGLNVQMGYHSEGDHTGFDNVLNLENYCEEVVKKAERLINAEPVKPGKYRVIIDPQLCGVFTHEAFGHLSESDFVYENENMRKIMVLGKRFGPDNLNIIDDPTIPCLAGSYEYDDEGVKTKKNYLIKDGILIGRLHNRETSEKMKEPLTGNARAIGYHHQPIVRMSNTYMDKSETSFDDMLEKLEDGIYAKSSLGGMTNTESFTFSAEEAFMVEKGKITQPIKNVILSGNVFNTLQNIEYIGNDLKLFGGLGGCGKGGQSPLPVSDGGPHILIKDVVIGGK